MKYFFIFQSNGFVFPLVSFLLGHVTTTAFAFFIQRHFLYSQGKLVRVRV